MMAEAVAVVVLAGDPPSSVTVVYVGHSVHVVVTQDVKSASASHHDSLVGWIVIVTGFQVNIRIQVAGRQSYILVPNPVCRGVRYVVTTVDMAEGKK